MYLSSPDCTESHRIFSVGAGHVARVFVGAARGWCVPDAVPASPEDVRAHIDAASVLSGFAVPESMNDASRFVARNLPPSPSVSSTRSTAR